MTTQQHNNDPPTHPHRLLRRPICNTHATRINDPTRIPVRSFVLSFLSDLLELLALHHRIRLRDLLPPHSLKVELARVLLRVTVGPAKHHPAPALKPREPHAPSASHAPVLLRRLKLLRRAWRVNNHRRSRICCRSGRRRRLRNHRRRRWRNERLIQNHLRVGRLLLFELEIAVAL